MSGSRAIALAGLQRALNQTPRPRRRRAKFKTVPLPFILGAQLWQLKRKLVACHAAVSCVQLVKALKQKKKRGAV